jgi:hypothetical protein
MRSPKRSVYLVRIRGYITYAKDSILKSIAYLALGILVKVVSFHWTSIDKVLIELPRYENQSTSLRF